MSLILKHALANAHKYGKADVKAVASKVFGEDPSARKDPDGTLHKVRDTVAGVNELTPAEVEEQLRKLAPELLEERHEEEEKELPELEDAREGEVRVRLPPEPNGYPHIGHAMSFYINYLYARKYKGEVVLKFEDTNPLKERMEFYDAIERDLEWAGIEWDHTFFLSDEFGALQEGARELIRLGHAYVCTCPHADIRERRREKVADPCRQNNALENEGLWEEMLEGKRHVLRWRGDPQSDNSVLRDPTLYRVLDATHQRTGENHIVYPTYDFASAFTDGLLEITHVLRSEEFLMRTPLHEAIIRELGMNPPHYRHYGRFQMEGTPTSKRKIRPLVESGEVEGWDDPRLATLMGLRRKGILPKTFEDLAMATGPYRGRSTISWKLLLGLNRKNVDPIARRCFVVVDPVELELEGDDFTARVPAHPQDPEMGERELLLRDRVFIERSDYKDGATIRLKGAYNVRLEGDRAVYVGDEIIRPIVHWVSQPVDCEVTFSERLFEEGELQPLDRREALAEKGLADCPGEFVQMERVGFARIDSRKPLKLIYLSD